MKLGDIGMPLPPVVRLCNYKIDRGILFNSEMNSCACNNKKAFQYNGNRLLAHCLFSVASH